MKKGIDKENRNKKVDIYEAKEQALIFSEGL